MPKNPPEDEKSNGRKITKKQSSQSLTIRNKKNSQAKLSSGNGIAKSKQLLSKLKTTRSSRSTSNSGRSSRSNGAPRVCGNGMPMPSLAELEQMYDDDSDDDSNNNVAHTKVENDPGRCKTPVQQPLVISEDKLTSPTTLKVIASKMINLITNLPVNAIGDPPPPPVIPPKKRKKSDTPYIVGCKDRLQVPWAPKTSFCKGDEKYGVKQHNDNDDEENSTHRKRRRLGKANVSKSIFNAKSDEIASWLKQSEQFDEQVVKSHSSAEQRKRQASSDSDKTVDYNFGAGSPLNVNRFSPIPSTSRDDDTYLINVQRFNESLHSSNTNKTTTDSDNDIEILNGPVETVVIDDYSPVMKIEPMNHTDDDDCVIVEPQSNISRMDTNVINIDSPNMDTNIINIDSPNDNGYGSLDFNLNLENNDCEIIDVDDVLAESQAIITKYKKQDGLDSVTVVEPGRSYGSKPSDCRGNGPVTIEEPVTVPSDRRGNNLVTIEEPADTSAIEDVVTNFFVNSNYGTSAIEDVVTNFFVNSNDGTHNSITVDLTDVSEIPRAWTAFIAHPPPTKDLNSNSQNVQSTAPTLHHRSDPPATMSAPADVHAPVPFVHSIQSLTSWREYLSSLLPFAPRNDLNSNGQNVQPLAPSVSHISHPSATMSAPAAVHASVPVNVNERRRVVTNTRSWRNGAPPTFPVVQSNTRNNRNQRNRDPPTIQDVAPPPLQSPPNNTSSRRLGDCPICMETLGSSAIASTICGHIFCMDCIKASIQTNGKRCPTCRKILKGKDGYHQLFL